MGQKFRRQMGQKFGRYREHKVRQMEQKFGRWSQSSAALTKVRQMGQKFGRWRYPEDPILKNFNPCIEKIIFNNIENGTCWDLKNQYHDQSYIDLEIDQD